MRIRDNVDKKHLTKTVAYGRHSKTDITTIIMSFINFVSFLFSFSEGCHKYLVRQINRATFTLRGKVTQLVC